MILRTCHDLDDSVDAGQEAVARLSAGEVIGVATDYGYAAACRNARQLQACLDGREDSAEIVLALRHPEEIYDYLPDLPKPAWRLLSRSAAGSLVLRFPSTDKALLFDRPEDLSLLEAETRQIACPEGARNRSVLASSGALSKFIHPYTAWPLYLLWPKEFTGNTAFRCCQTASSLVDCLPNCLNYVIETGIVQADGPPAIVEFSDEGVRIIPSSEMNESTILEKGRAGVLFVCTGNTCRSPMAEVLCRKMLAERLNCDPEEVSKHGIEVASAGIAADYGLPASAEAVELLAAEGVDLTAHQSQPLTQSLLERSDHVYTLTRHHRDIIVAHRPELQDRVSVLGRDGRDIPDPIGGDLAIYRECKDVIEANLKPIVDDLIAHLDK